MSGDLDLSTSAREGCAVVRVAGEVDLGTASQLDDYVTGAMQESGPHLILDLSAVSFMDSTGLKVMLACHRRARLGGGALGLSGPSTTVRRLLTLTGLDQTFIIGETVDEVATALTAGAGFHEAPVSQPGTPSTDAPAIAD